METKSAVNILRKFNKWLRNRGKKYVVCDICIDDVCCALKTTTDRLSKSMDEEEFISLFNLAEEAVGYRKRDKEIVTDRHKAALRAGRKIVRFLTKNDD